MFLMQHYILKCRLWIYDEFSIVHFIIKEKGLVALQEHYKNVI